MIEDDGEEPLLKIGIPSLGIGAGVNRVGSGKKGLIPRNPEWSYLYKIAKDMGDSFKEVAPQLHTKYLELRAIDAWYKTQHLLENSNE